MSENLTNKSAADFLKELTQKYSMPKEITDKLSENSKQLENTLRGITLNDLISVINKCNAQSQTTLENNTSNEEKQ